VLYSESADEGGDDPIGVLVELVRQVIGWLGYSRAGKPVCRERLDAEWLSIVADLLC
jgi:hypothetical protein